jgi:hypothetical protein
MILDLAVMHDSRINTTAEYRLNCGTRWTYTRADAVDDLAPPDASIRFKRVSSIG